MLVLAGVVILLLLVVELLPLVVVVVEPLLLVEPLVVVVVVLLLVVELLLRLLDDGGAGRGVAALQAEAVLLDVELALVLLGEPHRSHRLRRVERVRGHLGQLLLEVGQQLGDVPALPGPGLGPGVRPQLAVAADPHPREEARHAARQLVPPVLGGLRQCDRQGQYHLRRRDIVILTLLYQAPLQNFESMYLQCRFYIRTNIDDFNSNFLIPLPSLDDP